MKFTLFALFALASLNAYSVYDADTYSPDENHLPGYKSPALQKQAQEERPSTPTRLERINADSDELGSKVGPNPEAVDKKPSRREKLYD